MGAGGRPPRRQKWPEARAAARLAIPCFDDAKDGLLGVTAHACERARTLAVLAATPLDGAAGGAARAQLAHARRPSRRFRAMALSREAYPSVRWPSPPWWRTRRRPAGPGYLGGADLGAGHWAELPSLAAEFPAVNTPGCEGLSHWPCDQRYGDGRHGSNGASRPTAVRPLSRDRRGRNRIRGRRPGETRDRVLVKDGAAREMRWPGRSGEATLEPRQPSAGSLSARPAPAPRSMSAAPPKWATGIRRHKEHSWRRWA